MKKYMYKAMTSIDDYNLEDIEWKKLVKYAKKHLLTDEFVQKYMKELIDNNFVLERPNLSIVKGITKTYLESLDDVQKLKDIVRMIDKRIFINDVSLQDYSKELIELFKNKFKDCPIYTTGIKFLMCEDDIAFLSDRKNFGFLIVQSEDIAMGYYDWRKLHTIFLIKYGNEWLSKYKDTVETLYINHIIPTLNFVVLLNHVNIEVDPSIVSTLTPFEIDRAEYHDKKFKGYCLTL